MMLVLVFGFLAIGGLYFGFRDIRVKYDIGNWKVADGRILDIGYKEIANPEYPIKEFRINMSYEYVVNSEYYIGHYYTIDGSAEGTKENMESIVKKFPKHSSVTVYYDPQRPGDSCLVRDITWKPYIFIGFGLFSSWVIFRIFKGLREFYGKRWERIIPTG